MYSARSPLLSSAWDTPQGRYPSLSLFITFYFTFCATLRPRNQEFKEGARVLCSTLVFQTQMAIETNTLA